MHVLLPLDYSRIKEFVFEGNGVWRKGEGVRGFRSLR